MSGYHSSLILSQILQKLGEATIIDIIRMGQKKSVQIGSLSGTQRASSIVQCWPLKKSL
ncbi:hypothetical protein [Bartonella sp. A05]|uniref:hypothetical protein n=1 Tax=Bartonella sp. A05 TaxID=2967261 RepID=UPI0022A8FDCB|nr:hypothetical protein [Bartonella sp. A05]MCZ2203432.1 hypothetical protein [Bartonella sp. A05]